MTRFTNQDVQGYTAAEIAALNAEFDRRLVAAGLTDASDKSELDHVAERVLADFDTAHPAA